MPLEYNINLEEDPIYMEGFQQGIEIGLKRVFEKKRLTMIERLLIETDLSVEIIAYIVDYPIDSVLKIQERLRKEGKL
jgi:hypothetical protein